MARPIEKRAHIERAVLDLVAQRGLHGTSIQSIADAAGVSPGLLYRYWPSRDDLAGDVYRRQFEALMQRVLAAGPAKADVWTRLDAMVGAFLHFADEEPVVLKFLLLSQHDLAWNVPRESSIDQMVGPLIGLAIRQGVFRPLPADLALQLFLGIVIQPVVGALYGRVAGPVVQYRAAVMETLRRALGA